MKNLRDCASSYVLSILSVSSILKYDQTHSDSNGAEISKYSSALVGWQLIPYLRVTSLVHLTINP